MMKEKCIFKNPKIAMVILVMALMIAGALNVYSASFAMMGYGKGYYDRFLARFGGSTVGLCYDSCMVRNLPAGRYDQPVHLIVTQRKTLPGAGVAWRGRG